MKHLSGSIPDEYAVQEQLGKHPNIVKCFGSAMDSKNVYILMELCKHDLYEEINMLRSVAEDTCKFDEITATFCVTE